jgi:IS66 C-terminal element
LSAKYTLIITANMCCIDPQAWLENLLARIAKHLASRIDELVL